MKTNIYQYNSSIDFKNKSVIGTDEVGVGDYFGPLVACAVYIPPYKMQEVIDLGVKDSKKLSKKKVEELANKLKTIVWYRIKHLTPAGYNKLNKKYNANQLKMFLHISAINDLDEKVHADYVFLDQFSTLDSIKNYYKTLLFDDNWANLKEINQDIILAHQAESINLAVACGAIIARQFFIDFMEKMNTQYNIIFPLGAGNNVKLFAKEFFEKNPKYNPSEICKLSFKMDIETLDDKQISLF